MAAVKVVSVKELQELQSLERELAPLPGDDLGGDYESRVQYLRLVRRLQLRRSALVAQHGLAILNDPASRRKLGDEVWDLLEQVAVAAMDCNALDVSKECIGALIVKFRKGLRVGRLEGMWLEAKGWWDQASRMYANLLQDHPQDQNLLRRQVAVLKGQGRLLEACQALRKYLDTYQADVDAWRELADLYLAQSMLKQAAFCQEELLLSSPANPFLNLQYAETLYSLGGVDNFRAARSYYAAAVEYSGGENARALWGLCMVDAALRQSSKGSAKSTQSELAKVAAESLSRLYAAKAPDQKATAAAVLSQVAVAR